MKEDAGLIDTNKSRFHVGEKWHYSTRPGEEDSSLTILKVELSPKLGVIVHVSLDGLLIKSARSPNGFSEAISHIPFAERAIEGSVTILAAKNVPLPAFQDGYAEWRRAFDAGKGGIFTILVADSVDFIEKRLNHGSSPPLSEPTDLRPRNNTPARTTRRNGERARR
jgi:hypothetical protein